jgi:cytochrome c oxidase accessory protein FixG
VTMPLDGRESRTVGKDAAVEREEIPLFANRVKVYPRRVKGTIRRIKWAVLAFCLSVYYLVPWLRWDRGLGRPDQAILIDMANGRGYFFGIEIWPQEIYYIAGLLILGAVGLFFVTSLFGRLWCGYACPQTVWTDLFMLIERLIEGDRMARIRLDRQALSTGKFVRKTAKHLAWLLTAAATGGAWIMYFNDAPTVLGEMLRLEATPSVWFFFALFTTTTYVLAGWAREQVCTYMCPWPRFQSAMVDEETLTVTYRDWRGEKRGSHKKGESWEGRGDCVDCLACVAVCPTGIDIRNGPQLECIGCGLCIDACNEIMDRVERPRGLIAFDTYANQAARRHGGAASFRFLRPRSVLYTGILGLAALAMLYSLATRSFLEISVLPDRSPLFVTLADGSIRNSYTLKISNKSPEARLFTIKAAGLPGAFLGIAGSEPQQVPISQGMDIMVKGDSVGTFRAYIHASHEAVHTEAPLVFVVRDAAGDEEAERTTSFRGPAR